MNETNPIVFSLWTSSYSAVQIVDLLPKTDLTCELMDLLLEQCDILGGIIDGRYFLVADIERFTDKCNEIVDQVKTIQLEKD